MKKKKKNSAKKDTVATTNAGSECVKTANADNKKTSCHFSWLLFFLLASDLWNGGFFSRLEQRSGTKRTTEERPLIALLFRFGFSFYLIG